MNWPCGRMDDVMGTGPVVAAAPDDRGRGRRLLFGAAVRPALVPAGDQRPTATRLAATGQRGAHRVHRRPPGPDPRPPGPACSSTTGSHEVVTIDPSRSRPPSTPGRPGRPRRHRLTQSGVPTKVKRRSRTTLATSSRLRSRSRSRRTSTTPRSCTLASDQADVPGGAVDREAVRSYPYGPSPPTSWATSAHLRHRDQGQAGAQAARKEARPYLPRRPDRPDRGGGRLRGPCCAGTPGVDQAAGRLGQRPGARRPREPSPSAGPRPAADHRHRRPEARPRSPWPRADRSSGPTSTSGTAPTLKAPAGR